MSLAVVVLITKIYCRRLSTHCFSNSATDTIHIQEIMRQLKLHGTMGRYMDYNTEEKFDGDMGMHQLFSMRTNGLWATSAETLLR